MAVDASRHSSPYPLLTPGVTRSSPVLVSIIIPVYNGATTIGDQLDAVLTQTYTGAKEIIVVDNGSTDPTPEIVASRESKDVRLVRATEMRGPAYARNVGAAHAAGDLLLFCDADDRAAPTWVQAMVLAASDADCLSGVLDLESVNSQAQRAGRSNQDSPPLMHGKAMVVTSNCAIWRDRFEAIGGFDPALRACEDVDLALRLQAQGATIGFAREAVMHYRVRTSLSGLLRQWYGYGLGEVDVHCRHQTARRPAREVLTFLALLLLRWPRALVEPQVRNQWVMWAGAQAGRTMGSLRRRVLYL